MSRAVWAWGPWLDKVPLGGVEYSDGLTRPQLEERLDKIAEETRARPFIVTRTRWLCEAFEHVRLAVNTNDLFVHWHADSSLLSKRSQDRIGECRAAIAKDPSVGAVPGGCGWSWLDVSHTCPDWPSVIALGPRGLAARARERMKTARTEDEKLFLDCVATVYDALAKECLRWADLAERKGMADVAAVLRANAAHEPWTFREALQWALVYDRAQELEGEDVRSQGLFDRLFIDLYRQDLKAGRETRASAKRLVADWFTRFHSQQHPNNKNIAFGGYDAAGAPVWNELTELGLEVFRELGRINPKLTFRFGLKTPQEQVERVAACIAEGKSSIVFACEETLAETFARRGKTPQDIADYVLIGCYEPGVGGREVISSMSGIVIAPTAIEAALNGGCLRSGVRVGPPCALPTDGAAFKREFLRQLDAQLETVMRVTRGLERRWYDLNPSPLFSGSLRDCIANARDVSQGGARYNQSGIVVMGLGTVADSLAAVRELVDARKLVTMAELRDVLNRNWEGREDLRLAALRSAPKWGNNDAKADDGAKAFYDAVVARVNREPNGHGGTFQAGFWSINLDISCGKRVAATPDGRKTGSPLSRNNTATAGCGKQGPTALALSNARLDLANSPDGHILDVILPASASADTNASAKRIAAYLKSYARLGGQCIHLNCFDLDVLRDARKHPEKYPDLQVRVCGWNARWVDLSPVEQDHFLATAEAQEK